ncbi:hypothetical protein FDP41_003331 [Naegleria fowleri]|uniref:Peptidase C51 domain-containing protein n=1 Tax=Naegleria fowleri TaxID=5763 RepID=A0A6A5BWN9_NAEFO|nr:uncharacterized protein FDP41_003331 [Naegleria fowleri]KAF0977339.1 hypothetical protein FDP41_003331 [Naegleria fowleri]
MTSYGGRRQSYGGRYGGRRQSFGGRRPNRRQTQQPRRDVAARAVDRALGSRVAAGPTGNAIANKISQMYGSNTKATGYCARAVRTAIEAATGKTIQRTQSAKNYGPNLEKAGFRKVSGPPRIGDVAIFNSVPGHPHGHIQVLTERGWVSGFKQSDQYPGPAYRNRQAPMQLYRAE